MLSIVQVSHRSTKRLRDAVMGVNVEEIKQCIEESRAVVNIALEVLECA